MTEELEALVSHIFVVGSRAVSASPPGALVQLAPSSAPPGRARDAFFALVMPTGRAQAKAVFYERMVQLAAERYFASSEAITTSLRQVLTSLNHDLYQHNQAHPNQPFYAEMACLVLRGQDAYIARSNGGLVLLWQDGALETLPIDLRDPGLADAQPLGTALDPGIKMARYQVAPGDLIALSDTGLAGMPRKALLMAGAAGGIQGAVNRLKAERPEQATAILMQFITADMPDPEPAQPAAQKPAPTPKEPATVSATPAAEPQARRRWQRGKLPDSTASASRAAGSPPPAAEATAAKTGTPVRERWHGLVRRGRQSQQALAESAAAAGPKLAEIQTGSRSASLRLAGRLLNLLRRGVLRLQGGFGTLRRLADRMLPEPEPGRPPSLPTPLAAGAAMLIPVAVVLLVVALALNTRDETAFELCFSQVQEAVGAARLSDQNPAQNSQDNWYGVMEVVDTCLQRRSEDPGLLAIRTEAMARLDEFAGVVRCPMTPLRRYQPGTQHLRGPVLHGGIDLYVLDSERSTIYRETLNEVGNALVRESEVIVQRGAAIGEFVIRNLVDITWLVDGGIPQRSALVAVDGNGILLAYSPTFPPATAQALVGAERWIRPVSIDSWQGRLYILDPVANQIWRYQPAGSEYPGGPEEYFSGPDRPDISNAVDFAIDQQGNVYILMADGSMLKYFGGDQQFFQFSNLAGGSVGRLGSANAMYLDTGLIFPGFYVMDAANQLLYETTMNGTRINSYKAPEGTSFRDLSGLTIDASAENMYVLARDTLYHIPKCGD